MKNQTIQVCGWVTLLLSLSFMGCGAVRKQLKVERTGARFATTSETAPAALFRETATATSRIIADWCSGATVLPSEMGRWKLTELLGDLASDYSVEWSLDSRSDEEVVCRAEHDLSRRYKGPDVGRKGPDVGPDLPGRDRQTGGIHYDFISEWVTFKLTPMSQGRTCVFVAPEVKRNESERQMGSYTNLEDILAELGGTVPAEEAACGPAEPTAAEH